MNTFSFRVSIVWTVASLLLGSLYAPITAGAWMFQPFNYDYDLIIIGAGASGLFAAGAATSLGKKTLLVDRPGNLGGDCTNAACVPNKALRSMARQSTSTMETARQHVTRTVHAVRQREDPASMVARNNNLDIVLVGDCHFVGPHELHLGQVKESHGTTSFASISNATVSAKSFLVATGAPPIAPKHLTTSASKAKVPIYTYQTLLRPPQDSSSLDTRFWNAQMDVVVVAGGGATACELAQSIARLGGCQVHLVTPCLLKDDDESLQLAAARLLTNDKIVLHLGHRVESCASEVRGVTLSNNETLPSVDALVLCLGRKPQLESLKLHAGNVDYHPDLGVLVDHNLRSISASHVYSCGDCCSAVSGNARTASHAAWTGYHAVAKSQLPKWLTFGSKPVHPVVPRVIYTDPELAAVGLSFDECAARYGPGGFVCVNASENNTDRADMEYQERLTIGFVEPRATKITGKILGITACGPAASELANSMSVAIANKLTTRDIAKSLHSYPSHGYLLYRIALSMALSDIWGSLEACGPVGRIVARCGRALDQVLTIPRRRIRWFGRNK